MDKLIRDDMPEWIEANKNRPDYKPIRFRVTGCNIEYVRLLGDKLCEEAKELADAIQVKPRTAIIEEIADLLEVIETVRWALNLHQEDIDKTKVDKHMERGGFKRGIVLESD